MKVFSISASIVVYNEKEETLRRIIECFLSLKYKKELVIFDNSPSSILGGLCKEYSEVEYIFNNKNIGFGAGHNVAFSKISIESDIHLILNPDIYFETYELEGFLDWFLQTVDISLALPKILNTDGTTQNVVRHIPTALSLIKRKLHIDNDEISVQDNIIEDIPFAHGCFMAFKTDDFKRIDGFDRNFFLYMEDIDIFIRAKEYGRTVINTDSAIYHEHRKGSSKNFKLLLYHLSSAIKFFWKYRYQDHGKINL